MQMASLQTHRDFDSIALEFVGLRPEHFQRSDELVTGFDVGPTAHRLLRLQMQILRGL
jgi:hypothetical protein